MQAIIGLLLYMLSNDSLSYYIRMYNVLMAITWTRQTRRPLHRGCPRTELSATLRRQRGWTQLQCSPWPTPDWTSFHVSTGSICLRHSTVEWLLEWHSRAEREKGRGRGGRGEEGYGGRERQGERRHVLKINVHANTNTQWTCPQRGLQLFQIDPLEVIPLARGANGHWLH